MTEASDADLVLAAQQGNVEAVGELYDRHHTRIFRYLWSRVGDPRQAEDLTGEVFVRMVTYLPSYRSTEVAFCSWLYRIAHNLIVDDYRKRGGRRWVPIEQAEVMSERRQDPAVVIEQKLTVERVERALRQIDPAQQEVVVLRFLIGLSLREVAAMLDKSVAAVKSLQHRGLIALRVALEGR
jgi:RNA polymerase sigma-70 factor (ECF subfamily)